MYKPAWKQEYIISVDYSLLRLFAESEDTLDEFLHCIFVLLWIDNRSVLARTGILSSLFLLVLLGATLLLLGYASASAIASRTNIVLIARALVAVRLLIALLVAVLVVALLIVVAALVVIAILLLAVLVILLCAILAIVLRSLFLTLVWLVWFALV